MEFNLENRRYTGSKAKLVEWIMNLINKECSGKIFADIFAGTGIIAAAAANKYDEIILNDFLPSNQIIYKAFFSKGSFDLSKLNKLINQYNSIDVNNIGENYFSKNFGGKYFSVENAKAIGFIREDIQKIKNRLNEKEYSILLTSLLYAVDKIANTVGHYDAYIRKDPKTKKLFLKMIHQIKSKKVKIYRKDANDLVNKMYADIVYIDPPYNSRQYSRFYHLLENLVKWEKPILSGIALKPPSELASEYSKSNAPKVFSNLVQNLRCKFIIVSYNNTYFSKSHSSRNKIKLEEITAALKKRGPTKTFKTSHKFFNSGKTNFSNHQELLFVTKVLVKSV